jgi:hypothetical protein
VPQRAGRALLRRRRSQLSERELAVAANVERYRYLAAQQIQELHFCDHATPLTAARTCRRTLERLAGLGVLWRLERRIGGLRAGSASYAYALAPLGHRLLHEGDTAHVRRREPSAEFVDHTLAIAQLAVDLVRLERSGRIELAALEPEPRCWRSFAIGYEGTEVLKPDLEVALRSGGYEYRWFCEIDLATHGASAILQKCRLYQRYWESGAEQDKRGLFPRVLFVAPGARRAAVLTRTIARGRDLNGELFAVTTQDEALVCLAGATP